MTLRARTVASTLVLAAAVSLLGLPKAGIAPDVGPAKASAAESVSAVDARRRKRSRALRLAANSVRGRGFFSRLFGHGLIASTIERRVHLCSNGTIVLVSDYLAANGSTDHTEKVTGTWTVVDAQLVGDRPVNIRIRYVPKGGRPVDVTIARTSTGTRYAGSTATVASSTLCS